MNNVSRKISDYFSLVKFSHTVFALPFALTGFALGITTGGHHFSLKLLVLILLCMVFARNSAMGFNRFADRKFDALNPRTAGREIPSGRIKMKAAGIFVILNSALFIVATGFINGLTLILSPIALLVILGYSLTKRITYLCHFILGLGLSLAPIGAYISVTGQFNIVPVIYSVIVITWVSGFDIIYALQDDEFDRDNDLHSIPSSTGRKGAIIISGAVHLITFLLVVAAGILHANGYLYWTGAAIFTILLVYQHIIVRSDDISRVNLAFATTNGIASILYALFAISDLLH
ncbi:MAG: UbiA-like polyprenyltransferase [Bacteroidales bacterium]|jgi:4-hydroxybenzoate polyprenyltransferase